MDSLRSGWVGTGPKVQRFEQLLLVYVGAPEVRSTLPGLISTGHPLGATGLAQYSELTWQLRREAGERQVPGADLALQRNIGIGGAVVVTMYRPAA